MRSPSSGKRKGKEGNLGKDILYLQEKSDNNLRRIPHYGVSKFPILTYFLKFLSKYGLRLLE